MCMNNEHKMCTIIISFREQNNRLSYIAHRKLVASLILIHQLKNLTLDAK